MSDWRDEIHEQLDEILVLQGNSPCYGCNQRHPLRWGCHFAPDGDGGVCLNVKLDRQET